MKYEEYIDKIVESIFKLNKHSFILLSIFVLGFILRLIAAINLSVSADDMHHVTHAINFLSAGRLEVYDQSAGLWHAFTSIIYSIFGFTQFSSRFAALFFGSFTIIVIYFLSNEFFDKKVSLISAFLLAIAPFHIKNTMAEMDTMAMFFAFAGILFFIRALKKEKPFLFSVSGIFLGLAIYTKVYPLLFIPSLLLYFVYFNKKNNKKINSFHMKSIFIFLLCIFIFTIPALTHNYLLYKDKGFMDLQFTRTLGLGKNVSEKYYGWDAQFNAKNSWKGLVFGDTKHIASGTPLLIGAINFIKNGDPLNFFLGIMSIILILFYKKEYRHYLIFSFLAILFVLPFLASIILLPKHYLFLELLLVPISGFFVSSISNTNLKYKIPLKIILPIILIFSLILLGGIDNAPFYSKSHIAQMIEFKNEEIPQNALVVADSRIYRGRINWVFQGRPYLEASDFISFIQQQDSLNGRKIPITTYFFECAIDDCGWGTIKAQPEFNATMESLVKSFSAGELAAQFYEPDEEKPSYPFSQDKKLIVNVYKASIQLNENVIPIASQPKSWFLYNIGYLPKETQFDSYITYNNLDLFLDKFAHLLVYLAVFLAIISPIFILYQLKNEVKNENINNNTGL